MVQSPCLHYLVFNRDPAIRLDGSESGAGEVALRIAAALAHAEYQVKLCARFHGGYIRAPHDFESWDLGDRYDVVSAVRRAEDFEAYHLVSVGTAIPLVCSSFAERCVSRILVSLDSSPVMSGVSAELLSHVADRIICVKKSDAVLMATSGISPDLITLVTVDEARADPSNKQWERIGRVLTTLTTEIAADRLFNLPERPTPFVIGESMPEGSQEESDETVQELNSRLKEELDTRINNALLLLKDQKASEALEVLRVAEDLPIPVRDLHYVRALCFMKMGELTQTREALKEELRHFPGNTPAEELLIEVLQARD